MDGPQAACPTKTLSVDHSKEGGTASPSGTTTHRPGIDVALTASPEAGYAVQWRGDVNDSSERIVVTMDGNRTLTANFVPHGTLANLGIASGNSISVSFKSRHAVRFELYTSSGSSCSPGTSGCTLAATVTKVAAATDAERTAPFGDHPSGKYWVRGQYCASGSASAPGVATDACGRWSRLFGPHDHTASTATPTPTYRLTVRANPTSCGNVSGEDDYAEGEKAAIGASVKANANCHFTGWTGTGIENASSSSTKVTMGAAPKTVTANFTRQCKLTVQVTPSGGGTTAPAAGSTHTYDPCPRNVNLSATPSSGYRFGRWSGAGIASTSSSSTTVAMSAGDDKTVTARFARTSCTLTVRVSPSGGGATTPAAGTHTYDPCKSSVNLSASPNTDYRFVRWDGSGIASTSSRSTTIAMKAGDDKTVTARFMLTSCTLTVRVSPSGGGTTTPAAGTHTYRPCPPSKNLTATANSGYRFVRWYGASGTSASTSVALKDGDSKTVTARFAKQCTLTARSSPGGTVSGSGTFDCYTWKLLTATVTTGNSFARWTGDLSGSRNPGWIYLRTDKNVRAVFSCRLTVNTTAGGSVVRGSGTFDCGDTRTVTVRHNDYFYLKAWRGAVATGVLNQARVTLRGNATVTAVFDHVCNHPVYGVFCPVAGAEDESGAEP